MYHGLIDLLFHYYLTCYDVNVTFVVVIIF